MNLLTQPKTTRTVLAAIWLLVATTGALYAEAAPKALSDAEVKQLIIQESISSYPGNCPCPYNAASNGSRCGRRSAYSRPGGYSPLCYDGDVSEKMVNDYRKKHSLSKP